MIRNNIISRLCESPEPLLLTRINQTSVVIKAGISNYTGVKQLYVIIYPRPIFNGGLGKPPLKLGQEWVVTSYTKMMWLIIHVRI